MVDDLLLTSAGYDMQCYANDLVITLRVKDKGILVDLVQHTLNQARSKSL